MFNTLGYGFELYSSERDLEDEVRQWLRSAGLLGEPSDDINQMPEHVYFYGRYCPMYGGDILCVHFRNIAHAVMFKLAFGGDA